jgi:hypothetical protein
VIVYDCSCHIAAAAVLTAASRSRDRDSSALPERRDRGDRLLADAIGLPVFQKTTGAKGMRISMNRISRATWRWSII